MNFYSDNFSTGSSTLPPSLNPEPLLEGELAEQIDGWLYNTATEQQKGRDLAYNVYESVEKDVVRQPFKEVGLPANNSIAQVLPERLDSLIPLTTGRSKSYKNTGTIVENPIELALGDKTTGLNTANVAIRVIEDLKRLQIPQEIFAKQVLSRSQGTLSELINHPKPWEHLKAARKMYLKMYDWLMLPENQKLDILRNHSVEPKKCNKRPLTISNDALGEPSTKRFNFNKDQKNLLNVMFKYEQSPTSSMLLIISDFTGIAKTQLSNFFANARRRKIGRVEPQTHMTDSIFQLLGMLEDCRKSE